MNLHIHFNDGVTRYPDVLIIVLSPFESFESAVTWKPGSQHSMPAVLVPSPTHRVVRNVPNQYPVLVQAEHDYSARLAIPEAPMFTARAIGEVAMLTYQDLAKACDDGLLSLGYTLTKGASAVSLKNLTLDELLAVRYSQADLEAQLAAADGIYFGRDKDDTGHYYSLSKHNTQRSIPVQRNGLDLEFGAGLTAFAITEEQLSHLSVTLNVVRDTQHNKD